MNRGKKSEDEQGYTVYGVSQIHKNTLSEPEKYPLNYTAIYDETATFLQIHPPLRGGDRMAAAPAVVRERELLVVQVR